MTNKEKATYFIEHENGAYPDLETKIGEKLAINAFAEWLDKDAKAAQTPIRHSIRPLWEDVTLTVIECTCGTVLHTQLQTREHWQLGHFDKVIN